MIVKLLTYGVDNSMTIMQKYNEFLIWEGFVVVIHFWICLHYIERLI